MSKAFLFLNTFEDAVYAVTALGFPVELVPQAPIRTGERIRVHRREELENAYHRLCSNNVTGCVADDTAFRSLPAASQAARSSEATPVPTRRSPPPTP